ncbi:MAG: GGDEF domain-containing protein [Gaiellales bacterium]
MRFRYKLSLMFVALALVPLVVVAVVMSQLISQDQTSTVDGKVNAAVAAGLASYHARLQQIHSRIASYASSPQVSKALSARADPAMVARKGPPGVHIQLLRNGVPLPGSQPPPQGPAFKIPVNVGTPRRQVVAWVPIDQNLFDSVQHVGLPSSIQLALVANGRVVASSNGSPGGRASGLRIGHSVNATLAGNDVRAQSARVPWSQDGPVSLVATYPSSALSNAIDSRRLRLLVPLLIAGLLVAVIAFFAAGRISQALTDLSARARALLRAGSQPPPGDELSELGAVIDHMSTELSTRVDELEAERARVKETLHRYGETLAATHDLDALVNAVLDTAVQATRGRGGRLLLYDSETGQATEHARIGTAIGSRTDLPMTVSAGSGLEGLALSEMAPRAAASPRPVLAAPIVREDELLGLVTVVDPEGGAFGAGDVETLAGLAVQAGVAIENARLHRVVEQQAVTDALTGLANRRQFYEVLGREYERAQRFGHELGLILLDIDDFKQINDTLGHLAGDAVLHAIGQTVLSMIREIDVAARYGGEEFAILLPQTGREGAAQLAQRLRGAIAERDIVFAGTPVEGVTASFGVAAGPEDGVTQLDLIASADAALYEAKRGGKNDVVVG